MARRQLPANDTTTSAATTASADTTATPAQIAFNGCLCFEVTLTDTRNTIPGIPVTKRFMATRDVGFPELCERLVAAFPREDLRVRRKERDGKVVIKSNFEVAYHGQLCHHCDSYITPSTHSASSTSLVVFDTLGLRALLNAYEAGVENDSHVPTNVVKFNCTVRDNNCTIL